MLVPTPSSPEETPRAAPRGSSSSRAMAGLPFSPRRPFSSPCFLLCFLLGFVAGLFPFAHHHLHLDPHLPPFPVPDNDGSSPTTPPAPPAPVQLHPPPPDNDNAPTLIVVTPTRARPLQAYYLHRLAHTLRLVRPPLLWLVVERGGAATRDTAALLRGCGLMYRHLVASPAQRGAGRRNAALDHVEQHRIHGIVYFADEENVYSLDLFHHLRTIRSFGTWPVAMLGVGKSRALVEGPVCDGSRVIGWHTHATNRRTPRRFHAIASGFAFNSSMLWDADKRAHQAWNYIRMPDTAKHGFQETTFIEQLVEDETHMEGIPTGCSRIMNFNVHLEDKHLVYPKGWQMTENLDVLIPL